MQASGELERRAARIKLLLMDCDGVLTDGRIWILDPEDEQKSFNTRDGLGLALLHKAGLQSGIISGRKSKAVELRALGLGMEFIYLGCDDKIKAFEEILTRAGVVESQVAYVGDDLTDIPLMKRVGFGVAVADASAETRSIAHYVTKAAGGNGAVREVVESILKSQGRWSDIVSRYVD
jgi:3-deoxy-D-manno-octulosonate 8-phosphate phosphatase (KDO 8-P phosphatase)